MHGRQKSALLVAASVCLAATHIAAAQTKAPAKAPESLFVQTAKNVAYKDGVRPCRMSRPSRSSSRIVQSELWATSAMTSSFRSGPRAAIASKAIRPTPCCRSSTIGLRRGRRAFPPRWQSGTRLCHRRARGRESLYQLGRGARRQNRKLPTPCQDRAEGLA
jgi:hypothetical protein